MSIGHRPASSRQYRFGGGIRGNLPAGTITVSLTAITGLDAAGVTNPVAGSRRC